MIGWVIITGESIQIWGGGILAGSGHVVIGSLLAFTGLIIISQVWVRQVTS